MQEVLVSVDKLQAHCTNGHPHHLAVVYEALQHLGVKWCA